MKELILTLFIGAYGFVNTISAAVVAQNSPLQNPALNKSKNTTSAPAVNSQNPLLAPSNLPFHYPPFDKIKDSDFVPAFEAGMAQQRSEVNAIANNKAPATFDNTIVALERSGQTLTRVSNIFDNLEQSNTNDEIEKIQTQMAPKRAANEDAINLNPALFKRIDTLYRKRQSLNLDPESMQLLERYHEDFVRAGARLSPNDKVKLKKIDTQLSSLNSEFEQNLLKANKNAAVVVTDVKQLDGLSPDEITAAADDANAAGLKGKYLISLQNTTIQPVLEELKNRPLRERIYRASIGRADGGVGDNTAVIAKTVSLRAKQAALLGYPNYATYILADESAGNPKAVNKMLTDLSHAALAKGKSEANDIQQIIDAQAAATHTPSFKVQPWDWAFYARQAKEARYHFDDADVQPYFEFNHVLQDGVFYAAHQMYGLTFKERKDLPLYRPDLRVFEVFDANGSSLGILIRDDFQRDNKGGGAWEDSFVDPSGLFGQKAVVINNLNLTKPPPGQPILLNFDEVTTMFHEFGHALHCLFSKAKYPLLTGTNVPTDFAEYPSQFNEMWARDPKIFAHYARNYKTGEPMPKELMDKLLASQTYGEGYATTEYLAAAMIDQSWHQIKASQAPNAAGVMAFEKQALLKDGISYGPIPPRYHSPYFEHIFGNDYAASYYAYIWSEVLARDTGQWFDQHGGATRANGDYFRDKILSRGRTVEPNDLFRQFYGRAPDIGPLLEYHGLVPSATKPLPLARSSGQLDLSQEHPDNSLENGFAAAQTAAQNTRNSIAASQDNQKKKSLNDILRATEDSHAAAFQTQCKLPHKPGDPACPLPKSQY